LRFFGVLGGLMGNAMRIGLLGNVIRVLRGLNEESTPNGE
jgi:hypothetical protein